MDKGDNIKQELKAQVKYTKQLRYGSIMIMADQDSDGSHIKGLVINFIHHFWPSLFMMRGFLKEFITPILKVTKGDEVHSFFTIQDFKLFATEKGDRLKQYKVKYYKGLGTSTDKEGKEYFGNFAKHQIDFIYQDQNDMEAIELGFSSKKIKERKQWLAEYNPNLFVDYNIKTLRYKEFIDNELIHFSNADNLRSIPCMCDGLKPGQRKILFACFKRNLKSEIKVAQLIGYVAEHSAYHHGEMSLSSTIIGMAQNFVGSNNINLMLPIGQFGSRNQGGKEHASARYIFTCLNKVTRVLFPENDDHVLKYLEDDNQIVEPEWYLPIIPMCLVNGSSGIGTGWSTDVPSYNHREIVQQIKNKLEGKAFTEIHPWYKGFQGVIEINPKGGYNVRGKFEVDTEEEVIKISELPIGKWTRDYKNYLEELISPPKGEPEIEDIKEYHQNNRVSFEIQVIRGKLQQWGDIEKKLKLITTQQITNIVMFTPEYKIKRYQNTIEIMDEFYSMRLKCYNKRKEYLVSKLQRDVDILQNKMKFITLVVDGTLEIRNVRRKGVLSRLQQLGLVPMSKITKINSTKLKAFEEKKKENPNLNADKNEDGGDDDNENEEEELQQGEIPMSEYNYLLSMPIFSLTEEKVEQLKKQVEEKVAELTILQKREIKDMWIEDLDNFIEVIDEVELQEEKDRVSGKGVMQNGKSRAKKRNNNNNKDKDKEKNKSKDNKKMEDENEKTAGKGKKKKNEDSFVANDSDSDFEGNATNKQNNKVRGTSKDKPTQQKSLETTASLNSTVSSNSDQGGSKPSSTSVTLDPKKKMIPESKEGKSGAKKPPRQMTLLERVQQKYTNQNIQQTVQPEILEITKRKKDLTNPTSKNTSSSSLKKRKLDEDNEDFDLDLDFLEPSAIIMKSGQETNQQRTLRSTGKQRQIFRIDSDSEEDKSEYNFDDDSEEEFDLSLKKPRNKESKKDEDYDDDDIDEFRQNKKGKRIVSVEEDD